MRKNKSQFTLLQMFQITSSVAAGLAAWNGQSRWPGNDDIFVPLFGLAVIFAFRTFATFVGFQNLTKYLVVVGSLTAATTIYAWAVGPYAFPQRWYPGRFSIADFGWATFVAISVSYLVMEFASQLVHSRFANFVPNTVSNDS